MDPITSGKLLVYERGMLGDHRKHKENFEKFHFHPQKLFFQKISGNSLHQNVSTRNKPQHQTVSTRNKLMHQTESTRNKSHFVPGRRVLVLRFVPGRHHLVLTFVPGRHRLVQRFVPGRHVLVQTITRNFKIFLILMVKMKFFEIFPMFSVVTQHHPFMQNFHTHSIL